MKSTEAKMTSHNFVIFELMCLVSIKETNKNTKYIPIYLDSYFWGSMQEFM